MKSRTWEKRFREERKRVEGAAITLLNLQARIKELETENAALHERLAETSASEAGGAEPQARHVEGVGE